MNLTCPLCHLQDISSEWHLRKHLTGRSGIHRLSDYEAEDQIGLALVQARRGFVESDPPISDVPVTEPPARESPDGNGAEWAARQSEFIHDLFRQLVSNKELPKYQFERRIDAIIAMFLPEIFEKCLGWKVEVVVPEFPIKKVDNNQSTNADYLLFRHSNATATEAWILYELKTDRESLNPVQQEIYVEAAKRGMPALLDDLGMIARATKHYDKYGVLQKRLSGCKADCPVEIVYLCPGSGAGFCIPESVRVIPFSSLSEMKADKHSEAWELFRSIVLPKLA